MINYSGYSLLYIPHNIPVEITNIDILPLCVWSRSADGASTGIVVKAACGQLSRVYAVNPFLVRA